MIAGSRIVRWESTADPSRCGLEVAGLALRKPCPEPTQDRKAGTIHVGPPAFVLTALGSARPDEIALAISKASEAYGNARACLAFDAAALNALDIRFLREKNIGLVLDRVDETTPLGAVSAEPVEAVRFEPGFVARAMTDGRMACVLDAMLRLAHDLGIATLGTGAPQASRTVNRFEFDYVSRHSVS
jgi:hypothetical protein